jgi:hypothetical protein
VETRAAGLADKELMSSSSLKTDHLSTVEPRSVVACSSALRKLVRKPYVKADHLAGL